MKEEIERRRAEAAEKRQKVEDNVDGEDRPFKCVSPRGSSLKVSPFPSRRWVRLEGVGSQPPPSHFRKDDLDRTPFDPPQRLSGRRNI